MPILDWSLRDTGYAVVSIKTTGLTHGYDRICEISVVNCDPGQPMRLNLDTLVNPVRPLAGAETHGIHDRHVVLAPTFDQVALDLLRQLQGRVGVGHNVNFTLRFLRAEFRELGLDLDLEFPFLDTMPLTAMLTRTPNRPLLEVCDHLGIEGSLDPTAAASALDTAKVLRLLLTKVQTMGLQTFSKLRGKQRYAFQKSFDKDPFPKGLTYDLEESLIRQSRHERGVEGKTNIALALYWDALLVALDDLVITDEESAHLHKLQKDLELAMDDIYMLHARAFSGSLVAMIHSGSISAGDRQQLAGLKQCLSLLGWAPGTEEMEADAETDS